MKKTKLAAIGVTLALAGLAGATSANADMLLDRGLPTANLNNISGASRSNVAWTEGDYTPTRYTIDGDSFTNSSSHTWFINKIRIWTVLDTATPTLWGGVAGSGISIASNSATLSDAKYVGGIDYQGSSGAIRPMHQVDFAVGITLAPTQTYNFFFDGTGGQYTVPFVHASNAALSGSPQDGSNNSMLSVRIVDGTADTASLATWTSLGNGWDKASDVNVQVMGAVLEPETYAMMAVGLGVLGFIGRRRKARVAAV